MIPLRNLKRLFAKALKQPLYAARVFVKREGVYFRYRFGKGKSSLPEAITIFLTHKCNLRCKMCGQWGEGGVTSHQPADYIKEELSLDTLRSFVDEISVFSPAITLFGGEPLLHPGCVELIRHIKAKKMHCLMITNGSLLKAHAAQLVEYGLDELNVSLDGGEALHDEIRGMPGLFRRIMEGLAEVRRIKKESGKRKPLVNIQCTITKYNLGKLEQLTDVAREAGADSLTFHNLIFLDQKALEKQAECDRLLGCSSAEWQGFVSDPGIDAEELIRKRRGIVSQKYPFSVDFYPNLTDTQLRDYYTDSCYSPAGNGCHCLSPWLVAYVFPDGNLRPCLNLSKSFGNIKAQTFAALWNGQAAVGFRNMLKAQRFFPACVRCTELYRY
jgi:MoaA/NifB/PqqE/SkfB family radical SAM enzyme